MRTIRNRESNAILSGLIFQTQPPFPGRERLCLAEDHLVSARNNDIITRISRCAARLARRSADIRLKADFVVYP